MKKNLDFKNIKYKTYKDDIETGEIENLLKGGATSRDIAFRTTAIYFVIGCLWILCSDKILEFFIDDYILIRIIQVFKGWVYVFTTSILIYIFINNSMKRNIYWSQQVKNSYEELEATHGQLIAIEEELRVQYDELQQKQDIIKNSEERYKLALDGANDAIWEWNFTNNEVFVSDKFHEITGYNLEYFDSPLKFRELIDEDDLIKVTAQLNDHVTGKIPYYKSEVKIKLNTGEYKWIFIRGKILRDDKDKAVKISGSITDISFRKETDEKVNKLAYYDSLTGIPNRTLFMNSLEQSIESCNKKGNSGAVVVLDLDNFKEINDTLGHDYGDKLLKQVAEVLNACVKQEDVVSRVGGDEFFIVLNNIQNSQDAAKVCEKIINSFSSPLEVEKKHIYTSASMGITIFPDDSSDMNILLKNADTAMYYSKENGKNRYSFFNKSMRDAIIRRAQIEKGLRKALINNEFEIYYQPKIDILTGSIKGFEALLRWNSPKLGSVSPIEFITIAEQTGLILPIGEWIIRNVCKQNNIWKKQGYEYETVAVNLSAMQLQQENFEQILKSIIHEIDIEPNSIELEITESILMNSFENTIALLNEFRNLGIKIALDDFGTGYSSLSYLKILPINTLKIDKSFIDNINVNPRDKAIADGIIQLAQKIQLDVVAEGVETNEQINLLKDMGCNQIQGYYFSKPLPAIEIEAKFLKVS